MTLRNFSRLRRAEIGHYCDLGLQRRPSKIIVAFLLQAVAPPLGLLAIGFLVAWIIRGLMPKEVL